MASDDRHIGSEAPRGTRATAFEHVAAKHLGQIERLAERRIGELLVEAGLIRAEQLRQALTVQAQRGGDTVKILISLGYIDVEQFLTFLAKQPGIHTFDLGNCEIPPEVIGLIDREAALRHRVVPIQAEGKTLRVGIARPLRDAAMAELEAQTGLTLRPVLCQARDIEAALERYYVETAESAADKAESIEQLAGPLRLSLVGRLVQDIDAFPALPETVHRIHEVMQNPRSSIRDAANIVTMDPPIAAKVLSVANSAAYGFRRQIEDLTLAITLMGLRETYTIVLSAAVLDLFEKSRQIDYKRYWLEAMCCAAATRFVVKAAGLRRLTGAFAAGLLHDIGRVALAEVAPSLYSRIDSTLKGAALIEAEEHCVGLSHTEAGYELATKWDLPAELALPIRFHHRTPEATACRELVSVVALADAMAHAAGAKLSENKEILAAHTYDLEVLGLDPEVAEAMLDEFLYRREDSIKDAIS